MTSAHIVNGKSLSERIRSYPAGISNAEIAADIPADLRLVGVVRAKQKRAEYYKRKQSSTQKKKRREESERRPIAWALAWAETFPPMVMP